MDHSILAIDTTLRICSVSVLTSERLIKSVVEKGNGSSSTNLLGLVDKLLFDNNLKIYDIDLFAAAIGPGSFTGIRVGLSTVKAIAYSLNKYCVGVPTLKALAHASGISDFTLSVLPSGRNEMFVQVFKVNSSGLVTELRPPSCLSIDTLLEVVKDVPTIKWVGLGAEIVFDKIRIYATTIGREFYCLSEQKSDKHTEGLNGWILVDTNYLLSESIIFLAANGSVYNQKTISQDLIAEYLRPLNYNK